MKSTAKRSIDDLVKDIKQINFQNHQIKNNIIDIQKFVEDSNKAVEDMSFMKINQN